MNEKGDKLDAESFSAESPKEFSIREEDGLVYHVKVGVLKAGQITYSVVAKDGDSVVSRRLFVLSSAKSPEETKLAIEQTAQSMDNQIQKHWDAKHANREPSATSSGRSIAFSAFLRPKLIGTWEST